MCHAQFVTVPDTAASDPDGGIDSIFNEAAEPPDDEAALDVPTAAFQ
jgi:hypothetical protein